MEKVIVIGSGFAGLSASCFLAKSGYDVTVIEKNEQPGGRARVFRKDGFVFDMGPSWYWMPDVFERFFGQFNTTPADYYKLKRLDPSYRVFWQDETTDIPANFEQLKQFFEHKEPGASGRLDAFMNEAAYKYDISMKKLVHQPGLSVTEFLNWDVIRSVFKMDLFRSMRKHVNQYFKHPKLRQLAEFPILFLGALPQNTPALYSMMNYADMKLGTWYPMGGMGQITDAMYSLALSMGVTFKFKEPVLKINAWGTEVTGVSTDYETYRADAVIVACDYHHADTQLLSAEYANYDEKYWDSRNLAPSSLLFYLGVNKKLVGLQHHNLFFDTSFEQHAGELYNKPQWPTAPLMYACCPSKTDDTVAPQGCENLFILIPVAPGLKDTEEIREKYYTMAIQRLEKRLGTSIKDAIIYKRSYAHNNFTDDYNAYKGNAYGLSNTLMQTAFMKPSIKNKRLLNLFYAGQLTVPGPGVPPSLISGEIAAQLAAQSLKLKTI